MHNLSDFWPLTWIYFCTELFLLSRRPPPASESPWNYSLFTPCSNAPVLDVCVCVCQFPFSLPRSISDAFGLCEYGVPLYTASSSFSFTCVTVSQFRLFTVTSGAFSFSGFTQCSVYRGRDQRAPSHLKRKVSTEKSVNYWCGEAWPCNTSWGDLESLLNCATVLMWLIITIINAFHH